MRRLKKSIPKLLILIYAGGMDNNYTLQTVERAIAFLEFVASAPTPPSVKDISSALDLNITTCYHLLRTLVAKDYIKRNEDGSLALGEAVGLLARAYRRAGNIEQHLAEVVRQLATTTLETSYLSIREGNQVVLKVLVEGSQRLRVAGLYVGLKGNEHRRAAGKAVLAHLDDAARYEMLESSLAELSEPQRNAMQKSLAKELPLTAARGWSVDDGQSEHGIISVGAPVFAADGSVVGAVGIVTPTFRMDKSPDLFRSAVLAAAAEANRILKDMTGA